jgi:hypothetical protein
MLTWRLLQACHAAMPSMVAAPASTSHSHWRPRGSGGQECPLGVPDQNGASRPTAEFTGNNRPRGKRQRRIHRALGGRGSWLGAVLIWIATGCLIHF